MAISLDPNAEAHYRRATALAEKNDANGALGSLNEAVRLAPERWDILYVRAQIYNTLGQRENAIADYREVIRLNPADTLAKPRLQQMGAMP